MSKLFEGKRVTVMGLGLNGGGVGVARFFCEQGAEVLVTDLKNAQQLAESIKKLKGLKIKYALGGHKEEDFNTADLIVKNPDVPSTSPYLEIARNSGVRVETDMSLFFKMADGVYTIGVTGTKGKSTTASLIFHILKGKYRRTFLAGNIGVSPLELLPKLKPGDRVVLELSSFELEDLKQSPNIAVITNIMPDHLNRYDGMQEYIDAKKIIFKYQTKDDCFVLNGDDSIVRQFAKETVSKIVFFSKDIKAKGFKLFGGHNLSNLSAAIEVAKLLKVSATEIAARLRTFKGVPNRQQFVRSFKGVKYFNDTTATMPEAAITAINVFAEQFPKSRLIFISGGMNKGLEYAGLALVIKEKVGELVMLPGVASDKIKEHLLGYKNVHEVASMPEAVQKAKELAKKGDVVVLSPGATSFNLFKNEFDRGAQFVKVVNNLR
jgi:UDP-N-acetylmuramoylalanine--D-glutamate ligase